MKKGLVFNLKNGEIIEEKEVCYPEVIFEKAHSSLSFFEKKLSEENGLVYPFLIEEKMIGEFFEKYYASLLNKVKSHKKSNIPYSYEKALRVNKLKIGDIVSVVSVDVETGHTKVENMIVSKLEGVSLSNGYSSIYVVSLNDFLEYKIEDELEVISVILNKSESKTVKYLNYKENPELKTILNKISVAIQHRSM